jgi:hypothetical protein
VVNNPLSVLAFEVITSAYGLGPLLFEVVFPDPGKLPGVTVPEPGRAGVSWAKVKVDENSKLVATATATRRFMFYF